MSRSFPCSQSEEAQAQAGGWLSGWSGVQYMPQWLHVGKVAIRFYVGNQSVSYLARVLSHTFLDPFPFRLCLFVDEVRGPGRFRFETVLAWTGSALKRPGSQRGFLL